MSSWSQNSHPLDHLTIEEAEERIKRKKEQIVELEQEIELYKMHCAEVTKYTFQPIPKKWFKNLIQDYDYETKSTKNFTKEDKDIVKAMSTMLFGKEVKLVSLGDEGYPFYANYIIFKLGKEKVQITIPDFSISNANNYKELQFELIREDKDKDSGYECWNVLKKTTNWDDFVVATKEFAREVGK